MNIILLFILAHLDEAVEMYRDEAAQFQESLADVNQNKYWLLMLNILFRLTLWAHLIWKPPPSNWQNLPEIYVVTAYN